MSFTSYFINKSNLINAKYNKMISNVLNEYKTENIKSETEFLYRVNLATKTFIENLKVPIFKYNPVKSTPSSSDINIFNDAIDDVSVLFDEYINLADNLNSVSSELTAYMKMLNTSSNKLTKVIDQLESNVNEIHDNKHYIFTDTFNNKENSLLEEEHTDVCKIDTLNGVLTLSTNVEIDYSSSISFEILNSSNGFPGNTHEVESINGRLSFVGENDSNINMYNMNDGKESTYFEYESYKVSDDVYLKCNGFGFDYAEGVSWLTEDDSLNLSIKAVFTETKMCNWISIKPFVASEKNSNAAILSSVIVSDGLFNTQEIKINKSFSDSNIVTFDPQEIRYIIFNITQKYSYETSIGHFYTLKLSNDINIFDKINKENYRLMDRYKPSVSLLGLTYDPNNKQYIQPNYETFNESGINMNELKNELFTVKSPSNDDEYNDIEMITGYRYSIGVKEIQVANNLFNETSIYCSIPYETVENIKSIELESTDFIPVNFKEAFYAKYPDRTFDPSEYINYEISFDNGNVWYGIQPKHRVHYGPCCYYINSDTLPSMRRTRNIKYINRLLDTKSVMLRITLNRPEECLYDTPVIYGYKLNIITNGDDNIEYI